MIKMIFPFLIMLGIALQVQCQQQATAFDMNERLGRGINMGNAFEAPTETAWGNPWQPEYFKIMAELGFSHVRIPVRWSTPERSMEEPPYTIYETFMNRIKQVVDTALKYQLHPIINMHHHDDLFQDPIGQKDRFLAQWSQIASFFQDYPDSLLFEVLNEPHDNLTPDLWNEFFAQALDTIRESNPTRTVLLGTALFGGLSGVPYLDVPEDSYLILSVHYYNPFQFTHQGASWVGDNSDEWLGTKWLDTEEERQTIINEFNLIQQFTAEHNIPVHVGEFGAYSTADLESRVRWTNFLARWFEEQSFSWAYWEFSAGFGIYNPNNGQFNTPLVNALLHNPMPDPTQVMYTPLLEESFEQGAGGWQLNTFESAQATMTVDDGNLIIIITNMGTESWHVQLSKQGIPLLKNNLYKVTFDAFAQENPRYATSYMGKSSSPWTSYSSYNTTHIDTQENTYNFTFFMNNPDDNNARMVFDLGLSDTNIAFSRILIERLDLVTSIHSPGLSNINIYPNPTREHFIVTNLDEFHTLTLFDFGGRNLRSYKVNHPEFKMDMSGILPGSYILQAKNDNESYNFKVIKK
ncbi:MAG: T9SS C-terminal target domain-containing protein [Bacteroidetes bacterium]|nr:MAG: T9SS C-terminal target domain-containing protein [Bacteroidota bacterium]